MRGRGEPRGEAVALGADSANCAGSNGPRMRPLSEALMRPWSHSAVMAVHDAPLT